MDKSELQKYTSRETASVQEVMRQINANAGGALFLTDARGKLRGSVTDGDIRRFLLAGGKLDENVQTAARREPTIARSRKEAVELYRKTNYSAIPILDADGVIIDIYAGKRAAQQRHAPLRIPVVINAGGKGTRLAPYTKILPKPLIPVGELPILEHIMREYRKYGCDDFHIIVNYKRELIKAYFAESEERYNIAWYNEEKPLGTGGGLSLLRGKMKDTFFFSNCDNLLLTDYEKILRFHREHGNQITMICVNKGFPIPYGVVETSGDGKFLGIKEKPLLSFPINTGIYLVEPEVLDDMEDGVAVGFPDVVEKERKKGKNVGVYPVIDDEWMDMGQIDALEEMRERLETT